jgi:hypothetical protein
MGSQSAESEAPAAVSWFSNVLEKQTDRFCLLQQTLLWKACMRQAQLRERPSDTEMSGRCADSQSAHLNYP